MSRVRAGVIGVGRLGATHARLLAASPDFELVGVHDRDAGRATQVAGTFDAVTFASPEDLAAAVDAAVVAVPTVAHLEVASVALEAGCHALVEKPLASTVDEADELIGLATARDRVLGVGHVERFNGALLAVDRWLDRPRFIESLRLAPFQPRGTDVTVILDLMIHDIDLVLALADAPLADVHAVGVPVITPSIDIANARLTFESGAVANITASRASLKPVRELRLFQHSAYFSLDLRGGVGEVYRRRAPEDVADVTGIESLVERHRVTAGEGEPLARELSAFADAIAGRPSRLVSGAAGRDALEVAHRITREIEEFADVVAQDS
ncbi:MAG: Gfo/Idh/MocA family oxidoreductase [Gemmatimonadetes bacterium]|nr:Gfo/Idh/MocA family oxidoreductase [Gemmatimonadota bacterium]